jgi:hypothetical protein
MHLGTLWCAVGQRPSLSPYLTSEFTTVPVSSYRVWDLTERYIFHPVTIGFVIPTAPIYSLSVSFIQHPKKYTSPSPNAGVTFLINAAVPRSVVTKSRDLIGCWCLVELLKVLVALLNA